MPKSEWYTAKDKKRYAYGSLFKQYIYGGRRLMAGRQIVALKMKVRFPSITPYGQVCIVAIAADCKSVTWIHRRFDSYLAHQYGGFV